MKASGSDEGRKIGYCGEKKRDTEKVDIKFPLLSAKVLLSVDSLIRLSV